MINKFSKNNDSNKIYDLEERTAQFGEAIIDLCAHIKMGTITTPLVNQLVRLGTSIGANYCEANNASSKKIFATKFSSVKKSAKKQSIGSECLYARFQKRKSLSTVCGKNAKN